MKTQIMILAAGMMVFSAMAQDTNEFRRSRTEWKKGDRPDRGREHMQGRPDVSPEQKKEMQARRLQLMEESLKEIGISDEQREQIAELQKAHHEKMKAVSKKAGEARELLSQLQDSGASEAELDTAIEAVSNAQSEQLKILVRNRMEMEKILGKEKYKQFMDNARKQFRKHGRRGGSGMPPRPSGPDDGPGKPPKPSEAPDA